MPNKNKIISTIQPKDCQTCKPKPDCSKLLRALKAQFKVAMAQLNVALVHSTAATQLLGIAQGQDCDNFDSSILSLANNLIRADREIQRAINQGIFATTQLNDILSNCTNLTSCDIPAILRINEVLDDTLAQSREAEQRLHSAYLNICSLQATVCNKSKLWNAVLAEIRLADDQLPIILTGRLNREAIGCINGCTLTDNTPDNGEQ